MADDRLTALLIEDSLSDAFLLQELLAVGRPRLKLLHAERLQDGLELLRQGSIDVVLLDLSLPDASGIDTVIRTHAAFPDVPIVVLTGLDDEATAVRAMHEGAQDYLVKGQVDRQVLIRALRYARERKRTEEATHRLVREQAARASAEAAERRARFLTDASRALSSSLDYDTTLSTVARLAVPTVAGGCLIDLLEQNGQVRRVGAISADGTAPRLWNEEPCAPPQGADPIGEVLRQGEAAGVQELAGPTCRALRLPETLGDLVPRSALVVPLMARGHLLGTMTFVSWLAEQPQHQAPHLAIELGGVAALAVENARLYRAREQILEVVSHDLRTPLTTMIANLALIQDLQAPPRAPLEIVSRAAQHMNRLVEDLLDMSLLERGTFVLDRQPLEVTALLDEVVQMMRPSAEARGLRLQVSAAGGLPVVRADRRRLMQVLWNLVGNGIKFTPAGGQVELRAEASERELRLEVADSGPGIPEKQLPHVFERFWQGERSSHRHGAGLGLSIAKAIVEAHGGSIAVASAQSGTTFSFTLPKIEG